MDYFIKPLVLFILLVSIFHLIAFRSKGKFSKAFWKSGDYVWLSMAFFSLVTNGNENDVIAEDVSTSNKSVFYESAAFQNQGTLAINEFEVIDIDHLHTIQKVSRHKYDDVKLKEQSVPTSNPLIAMFPYFLSIALAIRLTMASAEVFNWYK